MFDCCVDQVTKVVLANLKLTYYETEFPQLIATFLDWRRSKLLSDSVRTFSEAIFDFFS